MLRWLFVFCFVSTLSAFGQNIVYKHPMPDARFVSKQTSIIFKTTNPVKNPTPFRHLVVQGEKSGRHTGVFLFDEHEKTIVFKPTCHFVLGEKVFVSLDLGIGRDKRLDYTFYIAEDIQKCPDYQWQAQSQSRQKLSKESPGTVGNVTTINGVAVPSDFPIIDTNIYQETAPGRIFFSSTFTSLGNYLVICENDGTPYWYRRYDRINLGSGDFKVQPSGVLTAFLFVPSHYIALDKNYRQFATYKCGHGYRTDLHECVLLPNEHALLIGEDIQRRDVSKIVPGGNKSANVIGNHLQEVDKDGNVYFEWRSWDYFNIEDAVHENLSASVIDYVHMNSIAIDYDGHYVISSRHLSEVSKISKDTGEFIWRFGGVNNQFSLINDTIPISYQHHAIPVPGKANYYTIFDNGNHRNPDYSRAVEFKLDLASKTAEKVWEYRYTPDRKCRMMGSVQRLPNNNTFIDWSANPPLRACEVTPDGDIVFEIKVQESSPYRSQRFEWNGMMDVPYLIIEPHKTKLFLIFNKFGDPDVENYHIYAGPTPDPQTEIAVTGQTWLDLVDLPNHATWYFRVKAGYSDGSKSLFSESVSAQIEFIEPGSNMVLNSDFSTGKEDWEFSVEGDAIAHGLVDKNGHFQIDITTGGSTETDIRLLQNGMELVKDKKYRFEFDAFASFPRTIEAKIEQSSIPNRNYGKLGPTPIQTTKSRYSYEFTMRELSDYSARVVFNCGKSSANVYIDNVVFRQVFPEAVDANWGLAPTEYGLSQNYPNPFNERTVICFSLPAEEFMTLEVFDVLGRKVSTLAHGKRASGNYSIPFEAINLAGGIFFYRFRAGDYSTVKKMVYVR